MVILCQHRNKSGTFWEGGRKWGKASKGAEMGQYHHVQHGVPLIKQLWGWFTSARGDESEETYLVKVSEIARVVLAEPGERD